MYVTAPSDAATCEVYRNNGEGGDTNDEAYAGPCNTEFTAANLVTDRNYMFRARGVHADTTPGLWSAAVTFISAGLPEFQGVLPTITKRGPDALEVRWQLPDNGGSPVLGYHVHMEAGGDGVWQSVYDGTNAPSVMSFLAEGLHTTVAYQFRVYAENRVGRSAYAQASATIEDMMAAPLSRTLQVETALLSNVQTTIALQSVNPTTGLDDTQDLRRFVLSVQDVCALDITGTICVRVEAPHPDYAEDVLGDPLCCVHSEYESEGAYLLSYTLQNAGKYSVLIHAIEAGGLLGQYWDNQWLYGMPIVAQQDPDMVLDWGTGAIAGQASDFLSVRWTGFVMPDYSENYTFYVEVDDSVRLWIDGVSIIDKWDECCQEFWGSAMLTAGELTSVRLEYREVAGLALMKLQWASFSTPKSPIPADKLYKGPFISDGPILVEVTTGAVDARSSEAFGDCVYASIALQLCTFYIQAKDAAGNNMNTNTDIFQAAWQGEEPFTTVSLPVVADAMDGLYKVEFMLSNVDTYTLTVSLGSTGIPILGSPFEHVVSPGGVSPAHSTTTGSGTYEFVAGTPAEFAVQARDAYGNPLADDSCNISVSIEWEYYTMNTTMAVLDDTSVNTYEFGRYFFGEVTYADSGVYEVRYNALREGMHKLYVRINEENMQGSPFTLRGSSAAAPYGPKSITEENMPPATAVAGVAITFQVQLRDAYGNLLSSWPDVLTVSVTNEPPTSVVDEGTCTAVASSTGLFTCSVVPTISGDRYVSVQVLESNSLANGVEVSNLTAVEPTSLGTVSAFQGPFPIYVAPGDLHAGSSIIYGLEDSYVAGTRVAATIQLRDQYENNLTASVESLNPVVYFGENLAEYITDNDDGTVTVLIGTILAGSFPVQVTLDGAYIKDNPTDEIVSYNTFARYDGTSCDVPALITAGIQQTFQCFPK
ncbi:unnamed protein product, partial [Prorocentrum cordatum]